MNIKILFVLVSAIVALNQCTASPQCQCDEEVEPPCEAVRVKLKNKKKRKRKEANKTVPDCQLPTPQTSTFHSHHHQQANGLVTENSKDVLNTCDMALSLMTMIVCVHVSLGLWFLFARKRKDDDEEEEEVKNDPIPDPAVSKPTKLKAYLHQQNLNLLLRKENKQVSTENAQLKKQVQILITELDDVKGECEQLNEVAHSASFYLRAIETVSKANKQLERQIEQQRNNHKQSTAELRNGFKEMTSTSRSLKAKFTIIAQFLTKMNDECSVCFNNYNAQQQRRAVMINCVHLICEQCALLWLDKSKTSEASCPTCRISYRREHLTLLHLE